MKSSDKKYWFNCNICSHEYECSLSNIQKRNCPYCSNPPKKLCDNEKCKLCFEKSFASHEKSIYWSNKNIESPFKVFKSSGKKYWFDCNICNHEFNIGLDNITSQKTSRWCPYCCIPSRLLCDDNDCKFCFEKSFASHEKSKYWSNKNKLNPRQIFKKSDTIKYIFFCDICNHDFERYPINIQDIDNITHCIYCVIPTHILCNNNDCNFCFEKSFASHSKSKYWSNKNKLNPRQIFKKSDTIKYIFFCDICNHDFERYPINIQDIDNITHCIYCVIPTHILCNNQLCIFCFERSFESIDKSKYWSNKNELKPRQLIKGNNSKFKFNCENMHEFSSSLSHITNGTWCPFCVNKTEQNLYDKLVLIYPELIQQYKVEWCKNIKYLPFDFCIEKYKIIIELDGIQHFEQVSNWKSPEKNQEKDKFKMKCANDNNYSVIRILQEDVFYDTFDWINEIKQAIQKIIDDKIIQNIFICKNNEYDIFNDF
jgi:very-short-patch-repair endonuclease